MIKFNNTYANLPSQFYSLIETPNKFQPKLLAFNHELAKELGIDLSEVNDESLAKFFSAVEFMPGSKPLAMAYAGHQFGHFSPQLGDGRAMLLGEFLSRENVRYDIHLKGSGRTAFSRRGDGKSALGPVIREYLISEGMHALKIPTTRTLCAVRTGEEIMRENIVPGGVLTRIAKSHIRVGTFEYFARRGDKDNVKVLADYTISRLYPGLSYFDFWKAVCKNQVSLISQWMSVGFIHGVMNTDNMNVSGETIDFGPCAFMDEFVFHKVFSSIDQNGRYAYSQQPQIALWNLARLAECLIPFIDNGQELFTNELQSLQQTMTFEFLKSMAGKFGLKTFIEDDQVLIRDWFEIMDKNELDFTLSYIDLERSLLDKSTFQFSGPYKEFLPRLKERLASEKTTAAEAAHLMSKTNPMTIPRNHHVERAIKASDKGDDKIFFEVLKAFQNPFERFDVLSEFQTPPIPEERVQRTFCGT